MLTRNGYVCAGLDYQKTETETVASLQPVLACKLENC
jgi:hypothetical protein